LKHLLHVILTIGFVWLLLLDQATDMHAMLLVGDSCVLLMPFSFGSIYDFASPMLFHLNRNKPPSGIMMLL